MDKASDRVAARTRVAAAAHRPPAHDERPAPEPAVDEPDGPLATVIPFGVFDADAEADRWYEPPPSRSPQSSAADEPLTTKEGLAAVRRPATRPAGAARRRSSC